MRWPLDCGLAGQESRRGRDAQGECHSALVWPSGARVRQIPDRFSSWRYRRDTPRLAHYSRQQTVRSWIALPPHRIASVSNTGSQDQNERWVLAVRILRLAETRRWLPESFAGRPAPLPGAHGRPLNSDRAAGSGGILRGRSRIFSPINSYAQGLAATGDCLDRLWRPAKGAWTLPRNASRRNSSYQAARAPADCLAGRPELR